MLFSFGLLAGCVSRQLEVSAHDARSVSSLIALVTRLAVEDGFVAVPELIDAFVLPHLAVDSESLPAALEMVPIAGLDAEATISMACSIKADTGLLRQFRNHFPPLG